MGGPKFKDADTVFSPPTKNKAVQNVPDTLD
jgi:hypothetical protein